MEKRENETLTVQDIKQILNISINAAYNLIHSSHFRSFASAILSAFQENRFMSG